MMEDMSFFGRIEEFRHTFGQAGVAILLVGLVLAVVLALWRGTGLLLFVLFLSYCVGGITYGGVIFAATLARWGVLAALLVIMAVHFRLPRPAIFLFFTYTLLGSLFAPLSPAPFWSLQRAGLLLLTTLVLPVVTTTYLRTPEDVARLFKMCIVAAAIGMFTNLVFLRESLHSQQVRFWVGASGQSTWTAGYFSAMVAWGIIQNRSRPLRIVCVPLLILLLFVLLLAGKRTMILGLFAIAVLPLFAMRRKVLHALPLLLVAGLLVGASVYAAFQMLPHHKADVLFERLLSSSTTGRDVLWAQALNWCLTEPLMGHGIGASDLAALELGFFHNSFLSIWYNTGLLGLLAVLFFLGIYIVRSFRLARHASNPEIADFARVALGYMLGLTAASFFEGEISGALQLGTVMLLIICALIDRLKDMNEQGAFVADMPQRWMLSANPALSFYNSGLARGRTCRS